MGVSLYIHIPFCRATCAYCGFYSESRIHWENEWQGYVQRLLQEIRDQREKYGQFDTIFIGGGNPLSLKPDALTSLLQAAGPSRETTIEMNPESLTSEYEVLFDKGLVTRVSMGVQSLGEQTLRTLGRTSTQKETVHGVQYLAKLHEHYHFRINYDLITCVPRQTLDNSIADIETLLSLSPCDHLSLYGLTIEEGTALASRINKGQLCEISQDEQANWLYTLWDKLESHGFQHYEISNFARNGAYSLHNLHYWHLDHYVGLGSHSAGRISNEKGCFTAVENTQDLHKYAHSEKGSGYVYETLSRNEEIEEYLISGLRIIWGIDKSKFLSRFGVSFDNLFSTQIPLIPTNLIINDETHFALSREGMMVMNQVLLTLAKAL